MRISDWSSDVCSSDLWISAAFEAIAPPNTAARRERRTPEQPAGLHSELQRYFRTGHRPPPRGRPVSRLHRHFAQQGLLSQRALLCRPQRAETDHRLVLERLSVDGDRKSVG